MTLSLALSNALTGLNVNQRSLSVLSNNIANANTEGYSRQIIDQSATYIDGIGTGVQIDDVVRRIDEYLTRSIRSQTGDVGQAEVVDDYMERIQVLLGEPGEQNSIDEYIEGFFNAVQNLAETPERVSFQTEAVNSGITLAREIATLAENLEELRFQADQDIEESVNAVNRELLHLDSLNVALNRAFNLGTPQANLLDERDNALKVVSEFMDIQVAFQETGEVQIFTGEGVTLLDAEVRQLRYDAAGSNNTFIDDVALLPVQVVQIDDDGEISPFVDEVISGGVEGDITTVLKTGRIVGLKNLRDEAIPDMLATLDMLADRLRDQFNAIHNQGSGFPGPTSMTGTRGIFAQEEFTWEGEVRIALLEDDGTPVESAYFDEAHTGVRPLTLDLETLNTFETQVNGQVDVQTIIDEINNYFAPPPVKAQLNILNNIQLVSNVDQIPSGSPSLFSFDFDLDNISAEEAGFFVGRVSVVDDTGADISNVSETLPAFTLDAAATFVTTAGSNTVTVQSANPHGLSEDQFIYIEDPGTLPALIDGIPSTELVGRFVQVANVTATTFEVITPTAAAAGLTFGGGAIEARTEYGTIAGGEKSRTRDAGLVTANLNANPGSTFYDITVEVAVENESGDFETGTITYRVINQQIDTYNDRINVRTGIPSVTGFAEQVFPNRSQPYLIASLVDEDGNEISSSNGEFLQTQAGFLKLEVNDANHRIHIDSLDSVQTGNQNTNPITEGTNRGFSHYFELNNFFESNAPITTGDTVAGSAINLEVEERIVSSPSLTSTGKISLSLQPSDPDDLPLYTYERFAGDNSVGQALGTLGIATTIAFDAAGELDSSTQSFNGYVGELLGYFATEAVTASQDLSDSEILLEGFEGRASAISGVNLDEELANTIIYQNAYTAAARIVTVTDELFAELLATFN